MLLRPQSRTLAKAFCFMGQLETVPEIVRRAERNYTNGTVKLGKYVDWSLKETIETIDAYLNSKHTSGETDSLGREKPFFNIVTAAANIWYRATDIDRKDIKFIPTKSSSVLLTFVANVMLQNWMNKYRFGQFLNQWGRALARYGSAVSKFVEQDGELIPSVVSWNRYIADPIQFDALPRIEKFYVTPAQLRKNSLYDQEVVSNLIETRSVRKTMDKQQKDSMDDFIELYEVHGELDSRLLEDEPELNIDDKELKYRQQMHVITFLTKDDAYDDYCLYKGKETKDPYQKDDLIEEDGRTLGIGAVEYLFDAQWMQNHTVKNMKDTLDISSRLIFQTSDSSFVGRNVLTAIETGQIMIHGLNQPLTRIANDKPDIVALQNFGSMWQAMGRDLTSTPEAARGATPPSGIAMGTVRLVTAQGLSLFEIMIENKGFALENMMRDFVIPHLKKQLKNKDEIVAILDDAGITEIDSLYIPAEAVKRYNQQAKNLVLNGNLPEPFNPAMMQEQVKQEMSAQGNKRFFKPDELGQKTWDEIFSDFEWDSIQVEVTNEQTDKAAVLQTLSTVLQSIASNPLILQDPNARMVFNKILEQTAIVSPLQLAQVSAKPTMTPSMVDGGALIAK